MVKKNGMVVTEAFSFLPLGLNCIWLTVYKTVAFVSVYIVFENMPFRVLISVLETSLLGVFKTGISWIEMFDNIASDAARMLVVLFWILLASIIVSGALWMRSYKKG
jgi:hypothetical protein